jgi:hypothetical protein
MRCCACRLGCLVLLACSFAIGCQKPTEHSAANEEEAVSKVVLAFQAALKTRDADTLWSLLDSDSQADAERAAKTIREGFAKATADKKAEQEKALGLPGADLATLTGTGFLKTNRFIGKYHEVPGSTIDKVTPQGDTAKVDYTEEDGDHETLKLVRQDGKWKLSLRMP